MCFCLARVIVIGTRDYLKYSLCDRINDKLKYSVSVKRYSVPFSR